MNSLSGTAAFLLGSALICLPRLGVTALYFLTAAPWRYPLVVTLLVIQLSYLAWRGERWAYYLVHFLSAFSLVGLLFTMVSPRSWVDILVAIPAFLLTLTGMIVLGFSSQVQPFLDAQRQKNRSSEQEE